MTGMGEVGSIGWDAGLGVLSTAPARPGRRIGTFRTRTGRRCSRVGGEHRWLADHEQVPERPPSEALAAAPYELEEAGCSRLGVSQGMVRLAVADTELPAQPLEPDRVAQIEELGGEAGRVQVVGIEARADRATDQAGVERVRAVLHEQRALCEALETLHP